MLTQRVLVVFLLLLLLLLQPQTYASDLLVEHLSSGIDIVTGQIASRSVFDPKDFGSKISKISTNTQDETIASEFLNSSSSTFKTCTSSYTYTIYKIVNAQPTTLLKTKVFLTMVQPLPSAIHMLRDLQLVVAFCKLFGTHYIVSVDVGARIRVTTNIDRDFVKSRGSFWLLDQCRLAAYRVFQIATTTTRNDIAIDHDFLLNSVSTLYCDGRSKAFLCNTRNDNLLNLLRSVNETNAFIIQQKRAPISDLIGDQAKRLQVQQMVAYYTTNSKYPSSVDEFQYFLDVLNGVHNVTIQENK